MPDANMTSGRVRYGVLLTIVAVVACFYFIRSRGIIGSETPPSTESPSRFRVGATDFPKLGNIDVRITAGVPQPTELYGQPSKTTNLLQALQPSTTMAINGQVQRQQPFQSESQSDPQRTFQPQSQPEQSRDLYPESPPEPKSQFEPQLRPLNQNPSQIGSDSGFKSQPGSQVPQDQSQSALGSDSQSKYQSEPELRPLTQAQSPSGSEPHSGLQLLPPGQDQSAPGAESQSKSQPEPQLQPLLQEQSQHVPRPESQSRSETGFQPLSQDQGQTFQSGPEPLGQFKPESQPQAPTGSLYVQHSQDKSLNLPQARPQTLPQDQGQYQGQPFQSGPQSPVQPKLESQPQAPTGSLHVQHSQDKYQNSLQPGPQALPQDQGQYQGQLIQSGPQSPVQYKPESQAPIGSSYVQQPHNQVQKQLQAASQNSYQIGQPPRPGLNYKSELQPNPQFQTNIYTQGQNRLQSELQTQYQPIQPSGAEANPQLGLQSNPQVQNKIDPQNPSRYQSDRVSQSEQQPNPQLQTEMHPKSQTDLSESGFRSQSNIPIQPIQ